MSSLRDAAFALDPAAGALWSVKQSLAVPMVPPFPGGPVSIRDLINRFGASGEALRALSTGGNIWSALNPGTIVAEISDRLRDPMVINQNPTGLCGPLSLVMEFARRDPVRYVLAAKELLETGQLTCPTGRVIVAEPELRAEPVLGGPIGQVDWLLGATMRDDENIIFDVDDDANGLESMTLWGEQFDWTRDVLNLPHCSWRTCLTSGEKECMQLAEAAVKAGGVAFFLVDANVIKDGGDDDEEFMFWQRSQHAARTAPSAFGPLTHSEDDDIPPDHWVTYVDGLNLGVAPGDDDAVAIRVWSWSREYVIQGSVFAFTEYLYAVVAGWP